MHTDRLADREVARQRECRQGWQTDKEEARQCCGQRDRLADREVDRRRGSQTGLQTDVLDRQVDRQA